jgi:hypothetical protein
MAFHFACLLCFDFFIIQYQVITVISPGAEPPSPGEIRESRRLRRGYKSGVIPFPDCLRHKDKPKTAPEARQGKVDKSAGPWKME